MFQLVKNHKERPYCFFKRDSSVTECHVDVTYGKELKNSKCSILKMKNATELKTCKDVAVFLGHLTPNNDKNSAGLASFDLRIL